MKQKLILLSIYTILLAACTGRLSYNRLLVQADSLMQSRPDSALQLLESLETQKLSTRADNAYYALLLTQARDKNFILQTDDTLIKLAIQYYNTQNDNEMLAKAHYYQGCVWRDNNDYPKAINEFLTTLSLTNEKKDTELQSLAYSSMGYLYFLQGLDAEADSIYQLAETLSYHQKDTVSLVYALSQRGMINLERMHYTEAEQQMLQALSLSQSFSDITIKSPVYESLSFLYDKIGDCMEKRYVANGTTDESVISYCPLNQFFLINI